MGTIGVLCSHRKKRMRQIKKMMQRGLLDPEKEDPFSLFVASTNIRYCFYHDTHKVLGNTFGMCVLQVSVSFLSQTRSGRYHSTSTCTKVLHDCEPLSCKIREGWKPSAQECTYRLSLVADDAVSIALGDGDELQCSAAGL